MSNFKDETKERLKSSSTENLTASDDTELNLEWEKTLENRRLEQERQNQNQNCFKRYLCCYICIVIIISCIGIFLIISYFVNKIDIVKEKDISKIPITYKLIYKRIYSINQRYDYVVEGIPDDDNNNTLTKNLTLAEIISRSLVIIPPGWYEVQEFRYDANETLIKKVLTVNCNLDGWQLFSWTGPNVIMKFITHTPSDKDLRDCEYKISWTLLFNGN